MNKKIILTLLILFVSGSLFAQVGGQLKLLNLGFMSSPNLYVRVKTASGWLIDDQFGKLAGELLGVLPQSAYGPEGVNISFYMLGHIEEMPREEVLSYKDFLKQDEFNYKIQGVNPLYKDIQIELDSMDNILDYGLCEIYGLPNSKLEMLFYAKTEYGCVILFFAAKGNPADDLVEKNRKDFIETVKTIQVFFNNDWVKEYDKSS